MWLRKNKNKPFEFVHLAGSLNRICSKTDSFIFFFFLLLATGLFISGIFMPILTFKEVLWFKNTFSVISGIQNLWQENQPVLASIVFLFSVVFPTVKLVSLFWLWLAKLTNYQRIAIINRLESLGKWSMLDVFVVAVTVVTVKLGFLVKAVPRIGIYVFASSVILTMFIMIWVNRLVHKAVDPSI
jgi:paraquat-inducible protein A